MPRRPRKVVFASAFEITVRPSIASPESSSTPTALSSRTRMRRTRAPVRTVAPAAAAARASAAPTAPMPPAGCASGRGPAADSAARRERSVSTVPGARGP